MYVDTDLANLIGSRICHDLISPIGAIHNGLELLSLSGASSDSPEMTLIAESCASAQEKLKFFRIAFGASNSGTSFTAQSIDEITRSVIERPRLQLNWSITQDLDRSVVQALLLGLLCLETALPQGGQIDIKMAEEQIVLYAYSPDINIDPTLWSRVNFPNKTSSLSPAQVQFAVFPQAIQAAKRSLQMSHTETEIWLSF